MATEIERKFLVISDQWRAQARRSTAYRQGYLNRGGKASIRVRIAGARAQLNVKSRTGGIERAEFEYEIPLADARELLALASGAEIRKTRFWVEVDAHTWEVDVFEGDNAGLVVAEIELGSVDEAFARPGWVGAEVSHDPRYYNAYLAEHPYTGWKR